MSVAKISEITASSPKSFEDAIKQGVKRADKTLKNVTSAWVADQNVKVENGKISEYQVRLKVTFVLED
ncbi:MAG: dodecin domain-containing protein [Thiothrix sp.]|nr:dodecin domain-containing protein [Thiothrix sp.]HPQ97504.1 dodecin family protein [Thiolinea sp.]